jgi:hypothetical protein
MRNEYWLGGYLSPEPLLQEPLYVLGEHLAGFTTPSYFYARNNPLAYVDPDGLGVDLILSIA